MFERFDNRALIQYIIKTKSDMHIGGHGTISPADVDDSVLKNGKDYGIV